MLAEYTQLPIFGRQAEAEFRSNTTMVCAWQDNRNKQ